MTAKYSQIVLACALSLCAKVVLACAPPAPTTLSDQQRVAQWYAESDHVFLATLVNVVAKPFPDGKYPVPGLKIPAEYIEFRIDKVYKGKRRVGSRYDTASSGFDASCTKSVLDMSYWFSPTEKIRPLSKQWVFYSSGPGPYRIDFSEMATPLNRMVGTVAMIEKLQQK